MDYLDQLYYLKVYLYQGVETYDGNCTYFSVNEDGSLRVEYLIDGDPYEPSEYVYAKNEWFSLYGKMQ